MSSNWTIDALRLATNVLILPATAFNATVFCRFCLVLPSITRYAVLLPRFVLVKPDPTVFAGRLRCVRVCGAYSTRMAFCLLLTRLVVSFVTVLTEQSTMPILILPFQTRIAYLLTRTCLVCSWAARTAPGVSDTRSNRARTTRLAARLPCFILVAPPLAIFTRRACKLVLVLILPDGASLAITPRPVLPCITPAGKAITVFPGSVGGIAKYVIVTPDLAIRTQGPITRAIIGTIVHVADALANPTAFVSLIPTGGTMRSTARPTEGVDEAYECENEDELERDHVHGEND